MMLENNKKLTCEFADELVSYLYNELSGADKVRFETHLSDCAPCAEELSEFSLARSAVQDWRNEEFLALIPPTIEIPYQNQTKSFENDKESGSWLVAVREFFTLSPAWATAATAFAALVICIGLFLVMFSSKMEIDDDMVQTKDTNIKVTPSPTTGNNSNNSESNQTNQKSGETPKQPLDKNPVNDVVNQVKGSTVTKSQNQNIKKQVPPKNEIRRGPNVKQKQTPPSLLDDEDEDDSLRLSDLLESIGSDD